MSSPLAISIITVSLLLCPVLYSYLRLSHSYSQCR